MKACTIILTWNGEQYLPRCLEAALNQTYPDHEVIVVDNASTDGSALIAERFPPVRLIRNAENLGFAGGMNVGLRATEADVVALLNQDTEVAPDWLEALVARAQADPANGIIGCKVFYPDRRTLQHAGGLLSYPLALADHRGYRQVDRGQYDEVWEVEYVTGAALAVRRDLLDRIGLLDEGFFPGYFEETDLCRRARRAGFRVVYEPRATLVHYESTAIVRDSCAYFTAYHAGRLRFVLKHYTPAQFLEDFVPAEQARLAGPLVMEEKRALYQAYGRSGAALREIRAAGRLVSERPDAPEDEARMAQALADLEQAVDEVMKPLVRDPLAVYLDRAREGWEIREPEFVSPTPLVGPLLSRLRTAWNGISTKWYVRKVVQQQNEFNWAVARALQEVCNRLGDTQVSLREAQTRLGLAEADLAEWLLRVEFALRQLNEALAELDKVVDEVEYSAVENDRRTVLVSTELARVRVWVQRMEEEMAALRDRLPEGRGQRTR